MDLDSILIGQPLEHRLSLTTAILTCLLQLDLECTWMRESRIDWIFQGPACAVLLINLLFLLRIMWVGIC